MSISWSDFWQNVRDEFGHVAALFARKKKPTKKPKGDNMTAYAIVRESTRLTDGDAVRLAEAATLQNLDVAAGWDMAPRKSFVLSSGQPLPKFAVLCRLRDTAAGDPDGAVAYHTVEDGVPVVHVLVDVAMGLPVADADGNPLSPLDNVSCALTHENTEEGGDAFCVTISPRGDGTSEPQEECDRCQGYSYRKTLSDGSTMAVTDFLLPAAFGDGSQSRPFDHLDKLKHARDIGKGGYCVVIKADGRESEVFGDRKAALAYSRAMLDKHAPHVLRASIP